MSSTPEEPGNPQQPTPPQYGGPQQGGPQQPTPPQYGGPQQGGPQQPTPPQYGPPQYGGAPQQGAPQYGQGAPQYGSAPQYGAPQWPSASPYGGYQERPARPRLVDIAFWLIIVAGALSLVNVVLDVFSVDSNARVASTLRQVQEQGANAPSLESLKSMVVTISIVVGIIMLGLYLLVAFFVRKGANWARILGTVFAAISLLGFIGGNVMSIIVTLLGVAAIVLLYLKDSNPYFRRPKF